MMSCSHIPLFPIVYIGSYQASIGQDIFLSLSQSSVSRCTREVADAICELANDHIKFPNRAQRRATKIKYVNKNVVMKYIPYNIYSTFRFFRKFDLAGIIGIVYSTFIMRTEKVATRRTCKWYSYALMVS